MKQRAGEVTLRGTLPSLSCLTWFCHDCLCIEIRTGGIGKRVLVGEIYTHAQAVLSLEAFYFTFLCMCVLRVCVHMCV